METTNMNLEIGNQCRLVSESIGFIYPSSGLFDPRSGKTAQVFNRFKGFDFWLR